MSRIDRALFTLVISAFSTAYSSTPEARSDEAEPKLSVAASLNVIVP